MGFLDIFKTKIKDDIDIKRNKKVKLGLALGGGATRGYGHIGALKAFEEYGIEFDYVAGTSVGSLVGALYCAGLKSDQIYDIGMDITEKEIKTSKIIFVPSKATGIQNIVKKAVGDITFEDLKIPFCAVAVDLISGEEIRITQGNLATAVSGSCAVPGVFAPVDFENMHLADGGLQNNIPADIPRLHDCDYVIAIDVNSTRGEGTDSVGLVDTLLASLRILMKSNSVKGYINSDMVIKPDLKRYKSTKTEGKEEMVEEGYLATIEKIPEILKMISKKPSKKKKINNIMKVN